MVSDYASALLYASKRYPQARIVLYGHSIGSGILIQLLSRLTSSNQKEEQALLQSGRLAGIILEAPPTSLPALLRVLYSHRLLPYRYLGPLMLDTYDSLATLPALLQRVDALIEVEVTVLANERDELVPVEMVPELFAAIEKARPSTSKNQLVVCKGALHDTGFLWSGWSSVMATIIDQAGR